MDMLNVFFIALMTSYNARLAKKAGQNAIVWGIITIILYLFIAFIAGGILIVNKFKGRIADLMNPETIAVIQKDIVLQFSIIAFGIGGALLVRFILERMLKNKPQK